MSIGSITGFKLSSIVGFIIIYPLTIYFLHRYKDRLSLNLITVAIFIGVAVLSLPIRIINFSGTMSSDLEYAIHLLSVIAGRICYSLKGKKYLAIVFSLLVMATVFITSTKGYDLWMNKVRYGTFTGKIDTEKSFTLAFETAKGEKTSLNDFRGKYLLLDCWSTSCGYCYKAMPEVQKVYEKYKENKQVEVIALHSRYPMRKGAAPEDFATGARILEELNYTIPCYSIDNESHELKEIGVKAYPIVLIIDPMGKLVFRGTIDDAGSYMNEVLTNK